MLTKVPTKLCCGARPQVKPAGEYHRDRAQPSGLASRCKGCVWLKKRQRQSAGMRQSVFTSVLVATRSTNSLAQCSNMCFLVCYQTPLVMVKYTGLKCNA